MFTGKFSGILGLIAQCAMVCAWVYIAITNLWSTLAGMAHKPVVEGLVADAIAWAIAAGSAYCIYRQFKFVQEDQRLKAWLVANAEKIRNNQPAYYRSQRITLDTELVRHHLVFSVIVMSFRVQTRWIIKGKEPRFGHALAASLYTLLYGWWGIPFGFFWTIVALAKNFMGATTVRVQDLLQRAPAKPVGFGQRFERDFSRRLHRGFFVDEKAVGILPAEPVGKV